MESTCSSLLLRLGQPDERAAWPRFIDLYTPLLYSLAYRLGLHDADAADLVQDVFVTLVRVLPEFRKAPGKSFRSWLCTVVKNRHRDALRRRAALPANAGDAALADAAAPDAADLSEAEYRQHLFGRAVQFMQSDFEEKTWKACLALVVEEKSGADVAAELGMTIEAVYAARSRVLRRLRQELDGLMD